MLLANKICVIVGAGSPRGIGYAAMKLFVDHGATVIGCDRKMDTARKAAMLAGFSAATIAENRVDFVPCDIRSAEDCARVAAETTARYGHVDCVVNCAGIVESRGTLDIDAASFDTMLGVNLKGAFILNQAFVKQFAAQGFGSIVNVASVAAQRGGGLVGGSHYAASKGGMISLTRSLAREFGPKGVRANVVCPSMTETGMLDDTISAEMHDRIVADIPLRRAGRAIDIAGACLFLASDLSAYVTGATIDVNGGSHIH